MSIKKVVVSLGLLSSLGFTANASAGLFQPSVTALGDLNASPSVVANLVQFNSFISPDYYTFSLTSDSNINVNFSSYATLAAGGDFGLYNSTGSTLLESFSIPFISAGSGTNITFSDIAAGSYQFKYTSLASVSLGSTVTFTATTVTPVPEPENAALMFAGLGLIGLIARRKFV